MGTLRETVLGLVERLLSMQMWFLRLAELLYRKGAFADQLSGTCRSLMQRLLQAASKNFLMRAGCGWFSFFSGAFGVTAPCSSADRMLSPASEGSSWREIPGNLVEACRKMCREAQRHGNILIRIAAAFYLMSMNFCRAPKMAM